MALILSEKEVQDLIDMKEVVASVEEAFRRQGTGEASNSARGRSAGHESVLNVMHANLAYLRRGGLKAYMSSKSGTKFVIILTDSSDSTPLAIMGANVLGRYRTGAASGVATKHLFRGTSVKAAVMGSGRQALTQVLALSAVVRVEELRVWSPSREHRATFAKQLATKGYDASARDSPAEALDGADVASSITSSDRPFITDRMLGSVSHLNICGSNVPSRSEASPAAVGTFDAVVVDDIHQGKTEYGDLILAAQAGRFSWGSALELGAVVAGRAKASGRTLFKSGGVALEDVAVASMLYDKARRSGRSYTEVELT